MNSLPFKKKTIKKHGTFDYFSDFVSGRIYEKEL
jgi:hypothetical protein